MLALGSVKASIIIFQHVLIHVLRGPVSFFDQTPTGRLLNRFGKDTDIVDNVLPMILRTLIICFFSVGFHSYLIL